MLNSAVTIINARNLGTTRFLTGSTPNTCKASSSSRILRAPRSAVIAVPATPARITAVTNGANSRTLASTKKPPSRSSEPNRTRKLPACSPGAPYPNATVEINNGNQHNRSANKNWITNSPPYGYGGRNADMIVLPVKIIMSPTCSNRFLVGKNARSATARTIESPFGSYPVDSNLNLDSFLSSCQDTPMQASVKPAGASDGLAKMSRQVAKTVADRERRTAALFGVAIRRGQVRPIGARDAAAFLWSAWKGMLTLGPRAERAAPGRDRELRALLEAGLRIVVGGMASDEARRHDETVRTLLESTPARPDEEPREERPLALERA